MSAIISFDKLFWLFFVFSFLGVLIEGIFCLIDKKRWEAHVLVVWGWFNVLYGAGAVLFYVAAAKTNIRSLPLKVTCMTLYATALEYLSGCLLKHGLGMKAWDYSKQWGNLHGMICPLFSLGWAVFAFLINRGYGKLSVLMDPLSAKPIHILAIFLCIFLIIDFLLAALCMIRWSRRHYGYPPKNRLDQLIDRLAPDAWMEKRFMEWKFLE